MSQFTTEIRYICEINSGLSESKGGDNVNEIINKAIPKIFNFDFPIFDENYRKVIETKILKHYYTREIGFETVGLWKLKLETKLNEIMPYYNQLYMSQLLEFNPLYTYNIIRERTGDNTRKNKGTGDTTTTNENHNVNVIDGSIVADSNNKNRYSDTPQGTLSNIEDNTYLTNATIDDGHVKTDNDTRTTDDSNGTIILKGLSTLDESGTEHYIETVAGFSGTNASDLILKYRKTFLNIDVMVINELEDLFFQLW